MIQSVYCGESTPDVSYEHSRPALNLPMQVHPAQGKQSTGQQVSTGCGSEISL